jgi:deoxyribodipyrimidine photolyase-related protein
VASGKYIQRMSNYCAGCRFQPDERVGPTACPFTTLYWDFLAQHRERLQSNQRMGYQVRNLDRIPAEELQEIRQQAARIRSGEFAVTDRKNKQNPKNK